MRTHVPATPSRHYVTNTRLKNSSTRLVQQALLDAETLVLRLLLLAARLDEMASADVLVALSHRADNVLPFTTQGPCLQAWFSNRQSIRPSAAHPLSALQTCR